MRGTTERTQGDKGDAMAQICGKYYAGGLVDRYCDRSKYHAGPHSGNILHFGSFDARFCGLRGTHGFTVDENDVNCPRCKDRDTLTLSPQGAAYVQCLAALNLLERLVEHMEAFYGKDLDDAYRYGDASKQERDDVQAAKALLSAAKPTPTPVTGHKEQ